MTRPPSPKQRERRAAWLSEMEELPGVFIPDRLIIPHNTREHWAVTRRRTKQHSNAAMFAIRGSYNKRISIPLGPPPYRVTFTRYGPRQIDQGNLEGSFGDVQDGTAKALGVDDGDSASITFEYRQEKAAFYGVRILISERK